LSKEDYDIHRQKMIDKDRSTRFTKDVQILSVKEQRVEKRLMEMRDEIVQGDHSPLLLGFFDGKEIIQNSELHKFFKAMPKGGHLHVHIEASVAMETFMNFTKRDFVYYNMKENSLVTAPNGLDTPGFEKCNDLRLNWTQEGTFDEYLIGKLLLHADEIKSKESTTIWDSFQYKFMLNDAVIHYHEFYREGLLAYYRQAKSEGVRIVELRHASGIIFDDNHNYLSYKEEFEMYQSVIDEIHLEDPDFELRVIVVGFKVLGKEFVVKQLESYQFALRNGFDFVTGFDLVNQEDVTDPIYEFVDDMLAAKDGFSNFNFYFHAGESANTTNENLYDAILLGSKRIGHGINIAFHPHLLDLVVERNIGYEICPISNFILGYTLDMRWHPVRYLMSKGVAVTISSDDPVFWDYQGIDLDFTYAFLAWQLDLKDVKQLAINSIKQSSVSESAKKRILKLFYLDWNKFIDQALHSDYMGLDH